MAAQTWRDAGFANSAERPEMEMCRTSYDTRKFCRVHDGRLQVRMERVSD